MFLMVKWFNSCSHPVNKVMRGRGHRMSPGLEYLGIIKSYCLHYFELRHLDLETVIFICFIFSV